MEDKDIIIERLQAEIDFMKQQEAKTEVKNKPNHLDGFVNQASKDLFEFMQEITRPVEPTEAEMKDVGGDDLEAPEEAQSKVYLDNRILDTYDQLVGDAIGQLNKVHADKDINNFIQLSLAREQYLSGQER